MKISQTEIVGDKVEDYLKVGTDGKGGVVLVFDQNTLIVDSRGIGHVVFSQKQARNFVNVIMKNIDQARGES